MKILLAGGDAELLHLVKYALFRQGHHITVAAGSEEALHRCQRQQPDLVLLDSALPPAGGLEVCRAVRQQYVLPIIMLLDSGDETDLLHGYEAGADDCIVKPFSMRQLVVRIDALTRRTLGLQGARPPGAGSLASAGDLSVDLTRFEARKNNIRLRLTRLEFRILYCLVENVGMLVETRRLSDYAWQSPSGGDVSLLKTHVSHIRQKLSEAGGTPVEIKAIPRTGYILSVAGPARPDEGPYADLLQSGSTVLTKVAPEPDSASTTV